MKTLSDLKTVVQDGLHRVPDPALVKLGDEILQLFVDMRPSYVPGRVHVSEKSLMAFYEAAKLCRERGMTAPTFVKRQLEGMARTGTFWAQRISSPVFEDYVTDPKISLSRHVRLYKSMLHTFDNLAKLYGPRRVLLDETVQFSPLFRATIANEHGYDDIVDHYREAARIELNGVPAAREVFADMLRYLDNDRNQVVPGALRHPPGADDAQSDDMPSSV